MTARHLPALGWDPCPGDVAGCRTLAAAQRGLAARLAEGARTARADVPTWRGPAARRHRERVAALPVALTFVARGAVAASEVVDAWAVTLSALQREADALEVRMAAAEDELGRATGAVHRAELLAAGGPPAVGGPWAVLRRTAERTAALDAAAAAAAAVQVEAQRLHERYAVAGAACARRLADAVGEGLRAPWSGGGDGGVGTDDGTVGLAADGGTLVPQRSGHVVAHRALWRDGVGEHVHRHAATYADASHGAVLVSGGLGLVPAPPAQAASRGVAAAAGATDAALAHFVEDDAVATVGGLGAAGAAVVGNGLVRHAARLPASDVPLSSGTGSTEAATEALTTALAAATAVPRPPVPSWDRPDHRGAARRTPARVRQRDAEAAGATAAHERSRAVRRCAAPRGDGPPASAAGAAGTASP